MLNQKDWGQKMSQSYKIDLMVFYEKLSFDSLVSSESYIFLWDFCVSFENVPCRAFYKGKNGVWNSSQMMWDSFQISTIIVENLHFLYFWNPSCVHRIMPVYTCFGTRTQDATHICRSRATLVILFPKIDFCSFKRLYFPF